MLFSCYYAGDKHFKSRRAGTGTESKLARKRRARKVNQQTAIEELHALDADGREVRLAAEEWQQPWQVLISVLLSARTRDETTIRVSEVLFQRYREPESLAAADLKELEDCIRPVNYYRTKAQRIVSCARMLVNEFHGICPLELEKLILLPGVGRKTANVFLGEMGQDAIGVDTHVAYVARTLGWTQEANPNNIENDLRKLFPRPLWRTVNPILVRFGKTHTRREKETILRRLRGKRQQDRMPTDKNCPGAKSDNSDV